jgi:hypothetical protein
LEQKERKARFGLTMSPDLLKLIDGKRELVPRATYIEYCMKRYFELENLRNEEVRFFDEILAIFPEDISKEKIERLHVTVENIRTKILSRKELLSK